MEKTCIQIKGGIEMKKKVLSILICRTVIMSPLLVCSESVKAATSNTVSRAIYTSQKANMIVDGSFKGSNGSKVNGHKTYKTVQAAIDSVSQNNKSDVIIYIKNGRYHEKITLTVLLEVQN